MSIVETVPDSEATGLVAELYENDVRSVGHVTTYTRVMALNPEAEMAWEELARAIARPLGMRRYELVTLAAALAIGSKACLAAHARKSLGYLDEAEVVRVLRDFRSAGLTEAEVAMMEYATTLSRDSASMTDADSLVLREHGFSDREIVDITLAAAARNYYSRAIHALNVELEPIDDLSTELRDALGAS